MHRIRPCHASSTARDGMPITWSSSRAAAQHRSHCLRPASTRARGCHGQVLNTAGGSSRAVTAASARLRRAVRLRLRTAMSATAPAATATSTTAASAAAGTTAAAAGTAAALATSGTAAATGSAAAVTAGTPHSSTTTPPRLAGQMQHHHGSGNDTHSHQERDDVTHDDSTNRCAPKTCAVPAPSARDRSVRRPALCETSWGVLLTSMCAHDRQCSVRAEWRRPRTRSFLAQITVSTSIGDSGSANPRLHTRSNGLESVDYARKPAKTVLDMDRLLRSANARAARRGR